jgi:hydroxymethylglutaryl-CoA lyase
MHRDQGGQPRSKDDSGSICDHHPQGRPAGDSDDGLKTSSQAYGGELRLVAHLGDEKQGGRRGERAPSGPLCDILVLVWNQCPGRKAEKRKSHDPSEHHRPQPAGEGRPEGGGETVIEDCRRQDAAEDQPRTLKAGGEREGQQLGLVAHLGQRNDGGRRQDCVHAAGYPRAWVGALRVTIGQPGWQMAESVRLFEVSLRDGLQNEPTVLSTDRKVALAQSLIAAGFRDLEVTSFVRPRMIPQLADAAEVMQRLPVVDGVRYWALIPNPVGLERALDAGVRHIATFLSASETHNQKNVNRTVRESLSGLEQVISSAMGSGLSVRAYISTVFGCPFEGDVDTARTLWLARALLDAGADEIALGDTTGMAHPEQVKRILCELQDAGIPMDRTALHFHDTRGTAVVNAYAAYQVGARLFDGSLSGVGGCPYAPGAAGNACTQDLLYLFRMLGAETGVDLEAACQAGQQLETALQRPLPGRYHQYWQGQTARSASRSA